MNMTILFPLAVGALELGAAIVYACNHQYWLTVTWTAYAIACVGLAFGSTR